jgi:hypothetical protein
VYLSNVQISRNTDDTVNAVIALLDDVLVSALPAIHAYIEIYGESRMMLLEKPLVDLYAKLITFGIQAAKLFDTSTPTRKLFTPTKVDRHDHLVEQERSVRCRKALRH